MSLLDVNNVAKYFGGRRIIEGLTFSIHAGEKVGLIGRNGCGKTTIFRMVMGLEEIDEGSIHKASGLNMAYLTQQDELADEGTLIEAMNHVFANLHSLERSLRRLEEEMGRPEVYENADKLDEVNTRYGRLSQQFEQQGGYSYPSRIKAVLFGLGFDESQFDQPLATMSGGQRMRAALARLLLLEPDMLLLDEPTNHLDLEACQWLEDYLRSYKGAVLIVSHDRYFLDRVVTKIVEVEYQKAITYRGNYSAAMLQKEDHLQRQADEYRRTQAERAKLQDYIRKWQAGTKATMAKSREKMLARLKPVDAPKKGAKTMHISFAPTYQSGTKVLYLEGITKGFKERLFGPLDAIVHRRERIGVVGPNGAGKSTLLSVITGIYEPDDGMIRWGAGVEWSYFHQGLDDLTDSNTVLEEMLDTEDMNNEEARTILGRFLFTGEDVFNSVGKLSGGERSRLTLAKLFVQGANLLILDEPTNHLDIPAKVALEEALTSFPGTVIFVSHDRYFIDRVATKVWEIRDGSLRFFDGGYSHYQEVLQSEKDAVEAARLAAIAQKKEQASQAKAQTRSAKAEVDQALLVEQEITALEEEKGSLETEMGDPDFYQHDDAQDKVDRYHAILARLEELYQHWEQVSSE